MTDLGGTHQIAVDVRSNAGAPIDPATAVLTITQPDGTTVTPAVPLPSLVTGQLRVDFTPTQAGRHAWRMVSTGPATSYGDVFDVNPLLPGGITSLADTKAHLNINASDTSQDVQLRRFIGATTRAVEKIRGEAVIRRTVVERYAFHAPRREYILSTLPVLALASVERVDQTMSWSPDGFDLDPEAGELVALPGTQYLWGRVKFTYDAGYLVIPEAFHLAALIIVKHLWETKRGAGGGQRFGGADMDPPDYGPGFAVPNRALELLGGSLPGVA